VPAISGDRFDCSSSSLVGDGWSDGALLVVGAAVETTGVDEEGDVVAGWLRRIRGVDEEEGHGCEIM